MTKRRLPGAHPRMLLSALALSLVANCSPPAVSARRAVRQAIRSEQLIRPERLPERTLAVLPMVAAPDDTIGRRLGWALTEMFSQDIARSKVLTVVERARIGALLQELSLVASGRVDTLTAPRAGKLLGARWVTVGSLSRDPGVSDRYRVTLRTVNVVSGAVTPAFDGVIRLDDVSADQETMTRQLLTSLGLSTVAVARATSTAVAVPLDVLLRFGLGVETLATGNTRGGLSQLAALAKDVPKFAPASSAVADGSRALPNPNPDFRHGDLRQVAQSLMPLVPIRTAEAVDVASSSIVQLAQLTVVIIVP